MSHLSRPYNSSDHRPDDFLGRFIDLPELGSLPYRQVLERPITSLDGVQEFMDKTVMVYGYDNLLPPEKWGVWQARYLEAAWWRLQDALSENPRLSHAWSSEVRKQVRNGQGPGCVAVHLDNYSSSGRIFIKDMSFSFFRGGLKNREFLELHREEGWPVLPLEEKILGLPGVAEREKFWEPLNAYSVCQAMSAWGAVRFGEKKFIVEFLEEVPASPIQSFAKTFGNAAGARLAEFLMEGSFPKPDALSTSTRPSRL